MDPNYYYIIDFHWLLRVPGITNAIPANVRNRILAIFTHHAHKLFSNSVPINPNFSNTPLYVIGCSGDYTCKSVDRGYYDLNLTIQNNIATLQTTPVRVQ